MQLEPIKVHASDILIQLQCFTDKATTEIVTSYLSQENIEEFGFTCHLLMFERLSLYDLHEWFSGNHQSLLLGSPEIRLQEINDWFTEAVFLNFTVLSANRTFPKIRFHPFKMSRIQCISETMPVVCLPF